MSKLIDIAEDTYDYFENKPAPRSFYYAGDAIKKLTIEPVSHDSLMTLTEDSVNKVMEALTKDDGKVAVLNFASARHPGGGWLSGSRAQEEALARTSNLYFGIEPVDAFYKQKYKNALYSDDVIYTEGVEFIKDDDGNYLDKPYKVDVITCAAPNMRALGKQKMTKDAYEALLDKRINGIYKVADLHHVDTFITGAWGCGVFGNNPELVALHMISNAMASNAKHIIFAVPFSKENYDAFKLVLSSIPEMLKYIEEGGDFSEFIK